MAEPVFWHPLYTTMSVAVLSGLVTWLVNRLGRRQDRRLEWYEGTEQALVAIGRSQGRLQGRCRRLVAL